MRPIANRNQVGLIPTLTSKSMRGSYSGNTLAFQANAESSILLPRSITGISCFYLKRRRLH